MVREQQPNSCLFVSISGFLQLIRAKDLPSSEPAHHKIVKLNRCPRKRAAKNRGTARHGFLLLIKAYGPVSWFGRAFGPGLAFYFPDALAVHADLEAQVGPGAG